MAKSTYILSTILVVGTWIVYQRVCQRSRRRLPPGPKPVPILGNVADFPPKDMPEHLHWLKHKDTYGGISSVTVMGMTLVIVHDHEMAHTLLERLSGKTSGRPEMVMANKLCGYEAITVCQSYTPTFRRHRKLLHQPLGSASSAEQFRDAQEDNVKRQLVKALQEPERMLEHYKTAAGASSLRMAYGYNVDQQKPDVLVEMVDQMMKEFSLAASPMAWAVDIVPALQHLPEGFPGATFKKTAKKWRKSIQASAYLPYEFVRRQMTKHANRPSYVSQVVDTLEVQEGGSGAEDKEAIIWSAASLYGASADTNVIALTSFTLAMLKFPEVQRKAQEEIDRVIGSSRLPTLEDRANLPYVDALVKETLRWWPVAPMGFPHMATEEFEFEGYHIPNGALILPAVWWFLHDPEVYIDPETFDPDRFLAPRNERDPGSEAYGYGRRKCPGRFFADTGLYLNIVMTLATLTFRKKAGKDGQEVGLHVQPKPGVLMYPTAFDFEVKPRSEAHRALIESIEKQYPFEASDAPLLGSIDDFQVRY